MPDNIELNAGSGGSTIKTDDDGTAHWQYVKAAYGPDNTQTRVTATNGLPVQDDGGSLTIDAPVGTPAAVRISDGAAFISPATSAQLPAALVGGRLDVNLGASGITLNTEVVGDVSLTGSFSVVVSAALPTGDNNIGNVDIASFVAGAITEVQGDVAHGVAVGGNPLLNGGEARTTNPTAVTDGQAVRSMHDDVGRQVIQPYAARDLVVDNNSVSLTLSTTLTFLAAGAAGVFRDLTMITISNPTASPALVTIFDGLVGGTARFAWEFAADGGGIALTFPTPFKQATAANGWAITSSEVGVKFTVQAVENV